ncbi:hypothetical protein CB1_000353004 [Camelus ferus]|nr:hypothetical protein CB1_000353004 [Camelus ferus]
MRRSGFLGRPSSSRFSSGIAAARTGVPERRQLSADPQWRRRRKWEESVEPSPLKSPVKGTECGVSRAHQQRAAAPTESTEPGLRRRPGIHEFQARSLEPRFGKSEDEDKTVADAGKTLTRGYLGFLSREVTWTVPPGIVQGAPPAAGPSVLLSVFPESDDSSGGPADAHSGLKSGFAGSSRRGTLDWVKAAQKLLLECPVDILDVVSFVIKALIYWDGPANRKNSGIPWGLAVKAEEETEAEGSLVQ